MIHLITAAQAENTVHTLTEQMKALKSQANMAQDRIIELEAEMNRIEHRIERPDCLYAERARLATRLQVVRAERRRLKDWFHSVKGLLAFLDGDKGDRLWKLTSDYLGIARKARADDDRKATVKEVRL